MPQSAHSDESRITFHVPSSRTTSHVSHFSLALSRVQLQFTFLLEVVNRAIDLGAFVIQKASHRRSQTRFSQVMHAHSWLWIKPPQSFEIAPRTRFKAYKPLLNTMIDRRVVTDIEMQMAEFLKGTPVAAVEHAVFLDVKCSGDNLAAVVRDHKTQVALKTFA